MDEGTLPADGVRIADDITPTPDDDGPDASTRRPRETPFHITRNVPEGAPGVMAGDRPLTLVVLGNARGGTTMTAGVAQFFGVEFGNRVDDRAEDVEINAVVHGMRRGLAVWRLPAARRAFSRILAERRARWRQFGFKCPSIAPVLGTLAPRIPDAAYVLVIRNPLTTAFSAERYRGTGWLRSFFFASAVQALYMRFVARTDRPVFVFSYEGALQKPEAFIDAFEAFLGVETPRDIRRQIFAYVDPAAGYRATRRYRGSIDKITSRRMHGWAADLVEPQRPLTIEIRIGDIVLATVKADDERPDVAAAGHHPTGACGFNVTFEWELSERDMAAVRLHVPEAKRDVALWSEEGVG